MKNLEGFLDFLHDKLEELVDRKVVRTVPATKDEIANFKELKALRDQISDLEQKLESKKDLAWGKINDRLKAWSESLTFDMKKGEIGYYNKKKD